MATCKECFHFEACGSMLKSLGYIVDGDGQDADKRCKEFKHKNEIPVLKSIKDEMPKDHQKVLCLCQGGIYEVLKWDPEIDAWVYTFGRTDDHAYSKSFVLYWMALPKKEEDHERTHEN